MPANRKDAHMKLTVATIAAIILSAPSFANTCETVDMGGYLTYADPTCPNGGTVIDMITRDGAGEEARQAQ